MTRQPQSPQASQEPDDDRLSELCRAHEVPEPAADFVADTLLRVEIDRGAPAVPEPSPGFVARVLARLAGDPVLARRRQAGVLARSSEGRPAGTPLPILLTDRSPILSRRAAGWLTAGLVAAALVLAFVLKPGLDTTRSTELARSLLAPEAFPTLGANRVARVASLARAGISIEPATIAPSGPAARASFALGGSGLYLPPPPPPAAELIFADDEAEEGPW